VITEINLCHTIGHGSFLQNPLQFIIHSHPIIRCCMACVGEKRCQIRKVSCNVLSFCLGRVKKTAKELRTSGIQVEVWIRDFPNVGHWDLRPLRSAEVWILYRGAVRMFEGCVALCSCCWLYFTKNAPRLQIKGSGLASSSVFVFKTYELFVENGTVRISTYACVVKDFIYFFPREMPGLNFNTTNDISF
jgi:hypothetical protein